MQKLFPGQIMNRVKLTPKTQNAMKKPYPCHKEIIVPCANPKAFMDSIKAQVGMAINAALCNAKALTLFTHTSLWYQLPHPVISANTSEVIDFPSNSDSPYSITYLCKVSEHYM
jgi:hypothetical protein